MHVYIYIYIICICIYIYIYIYLFIYLFILHTSRPRLGRDGGTAKGWREGGRSPGHTYWCARLGDKSSSTTLDVQQSKLQASKREQ